MVNTRTRFAIALIWLSTLLTGAPAIAADPRPWAPYEEVHGIFARFLNMPARSRDRLTFHLGVKPPIGINQPDGVQLTMATGSGVRRIPIDHEWRLLLPLEDRLVRENPLIRTNLQPGKALVLRPQLGIIPPVSVTWPAAELQQAVDQANASVRSQAGIFSLFAPKATSVLIRFADQKASVRITGQQGDTVLAANPGGDVVLALDKSLAKKGTVLVFSSPPKAILPRFPTTMTLTVDADAK